MRMLLKILHVFKKTGHWKKRQNKSIKEQQKNKIKLKQQKKNF